MPHSELYRACGKLKEIPFNCIRVPSPYCSFVRSAPIVALIDSGQTPFYAPHILSRLWPCPTTLQGQWTKAITPVLASSLLKIGTSSGQSLSMLHTCKHISKLRIESSILGMYEDIKKRILATWSQLNMRPQVRCRLYHN